MPEARGRQVTVRPASPECWAAIEDVLGRGGSVRGCWCMFFRSTPQERRTQWGEGNRQALRRLVESGHQPGLVAFLDDEPAGWCSLGPREDYSRLARSPVTRRVDDQAVWSLVCLYVVPEHRGLGLAEQLVTAALRHAAGHGARILEAYPVDDALGRVPQDRAYHGTVSLLRSCGFVEVAARVPGRPTMRADLSCLEGKEQRDAAHDA